jgi:2-hydroxychromene-2-carboxylate isomerase
MAGSSTDSAAPQARFYYDFASPEAYHAAERVNAALDAVPEWVPVAIGPPAFRCAEEIAAYREDVDRRAGAAGLQAMRWPEPFPTDTGFALLAATFAKHIGRAVAFSLAAFRQAYAAGRDLGDPDTVLLAAAACEMHPAAIDKGAGRDSIRRRLEEATDAAGAAGVLEVPAIQVGDRIFHGDRELEAAAAVLA